METLAQMYARHDRDMKKLMEDQQLSWDILNERYGKGNIPEDVYKQWDKQHGNVRLHGVKAQQEAEIEAYPLSPLEYRYQQEAEQKASTKQPHQPINEPKQQSQDNQPPRYFDPITGAEISEERHRKMQEFQERQKQREQERRDPSRGPEY